MTPPRHLPIRQQRLLALLLGTVFAIMIVFLIAVPVVHKHQQYRSGLEHLGFQVQRLEAAIERRSGIEEEIARLEQSLATSDATLPPLEPAVAGSRLQAKLQSLANDLDGFDIRSVQILPPSLDPEYTRIGVRIQALGYLDGLKPFIHQIETGRPLAWIDDLQIQPSRRSSTQAGPLEISMYVNTLVATPVAETP